MQDVWVGRNIDKWEVYPYDLADSLVGLPKAFGLMPQGASKERIKEMDLDPEGDEARKLSTQMQNRLRYGNSSDAGKIGRSLRNTVRSLGAHPLAEDLLGMDTDPEEFWAGGTCWDLRKCSESLAPAERASNSVHLHSAACAPDDRVATPLWDALLEAVWPEADVRDWAQLVLSAGLTGYPKKIVPLLQGGKDRGKSTIIDAIADVLGTYFTPLNPRVLDANGSTHDTVLMDLKGARMVFLDEGLKRGSVSTSRLKRLAGGSSITANRMRKDPISFRPTHTLVIALNPEEALSFDDPAVETRIRLLPCEGDPAAVIEVAKQLEYFRSPAWLAERPGVLAKLMKYAGRMLEDPQSLSKDRAPMQAQMAEELIREDEDDVLRWFLEATTPHEAGFPSRDLFISFREWTRETKGDRYYIKSEKSWALRMDELVPEDGLHKLYTRNKSRLRRVRPLQPGEGQRPKAPVDVQGAAASFMSPGGGQGSPAPTADSKPENPPAEPHAPADPPAFQIPGGVVDPGSIKVGKVGAGGSNLLTPYTHTHTHAKSESGNDPRTPRTPHPPAASQTGYELAADATGPRIVPRPSAQGAQDPESPLGAKNPNPEIPPQAEKPQKAPAKRQKLSDEERAAKKLQVAQDRAAAREEARLAKVAEVGGPIVPLPAIVLREGLTVVPCTVSQAAEYLVQFLDCLAVDVEHNGYPIGHENYGLRLVQLGGEAGGVVFDPSDPFSASLIQETVERARILNAHNAGADLIPLEAAGLCGREAWGRMSDTVISAKLTDPNLTDSDESGLKPLSKNMLGDYGVAWKADVKRRELFKAGGWATETEVTTPKGKSGWAMVPVCVEFVRYAASDVMDCAAIHRMLKPGLDAMYGGSE
jgi:P4 family phage/plasmid primase-like protien